MFVHKMQQETRSHTEHNFYSTCKITWKIILIIILNKIYIYQNDLYENISYLFECHVIISRSGTSVFAFMYLLWFLLFDKDFLNRKYTKLKIMSEHSNLILL